MAKVSKLVLGKRPEHFTRVVSFPMLDGSTGTVEVKFVYRSRKEFAELIDTNQASIKSKADAEVDRMKQVAGEGGSVADFKQTDLVAHQADFNAAYLMQIAKGWNLDVPFNREAVDELVDTLPAAVNAINAAYREALLEGRLGN
ncbi:hypothetical protein IFT68_00565 [Oxalobacteraceae sp. CFBP 13730]|nr:hypothetical protein [Oxalobacteraceae sp. CFBP 13730]